MAEKIMDTDCENDVCKIDNLLAMVDYNSTDKNKKAEFTIYHDFYMMLSKKEDNSVSICSAKKITNETAKNNYELMFDINMSSRFGVHSTCQLGEKDRLYFYRAVIDKKSRKDKAVLHNVLKQILMEMQIGYYVVSLP